MFFFMPAQFEQRCLARVLPVSGEDDGTACGPRGLGATTDWPSSLLLGAEPQ